MNALQEENLQFIKTFLEEDLNEEQDIESVKARFKINDLNTLTWTFDQVKTLKAKETEIKNVAQNQRSQIDYWENKELSTINRSLEFFQTIVSEYHAAVLSENPKAKTLSTPFGKSKSTKRKEQPEKANEETILQHVIESNMDEYIKQSLKWGDFKKELKILEIAGNKVVVDGNGQIVPGVEVKPESITFSMEIL